MIDGRRQLSRTALITAIAAAHLLAIWLLLSPAVIGTRSATEPLLTLFDVTVVPPAPPVPPPPPRATASPGGGGSPGIRRQRAAAMAEQPALPRRETMDATSAPVAPSVAQTMAGTAPLDLGLGGADGAGAGSSSGTGSGTGAGRGDGDGSGDGDGDGDGEVYARAEWIATPPRDAYMRNWPGARTLPDYPVTVSLACRVRRNFRPYRCGGLSDSPRNSGFALMVLRAVQEAKVRPVSRNGSPEWDKPVLITIVLDRLAEAPRITSAASAPLAR